MYDNILVPVDGSSPARRGLAEAVRLAKSTGAKIRLVHIVDELVIVGPEPAAFYSGAMIDALRDIGKAVLDDAIAYARQQGVEPQTTLLECFGGRAADGILDQAKQWPADLIVIGTHGRRGVRRLLMGSDAEMVVRMSAVPVLIVPDRGAG